MSTTFTPEEQAKSTASRLSASIGGFDQLVGVNIAALNELLSYSWRTTTADWKTVATNPRNNVSYTVNELKGSLLAPTIALKTATTGEFYIHFGKFQFSGYVQYAPGDDEYTTWEFSDWALAYDVDFSFETIDNLPEKIKEQVQNLTDYSAHQVLVDFSTTNLLAPNKGMSSFPGLDVLPQIEQDAVQNQLQPFMQAWMDQQITAGNNILGYAFVSNNTNAVATIPATKVTLQTYGYYRNGVQVAADLVPADSSFLFLNMFANDPFPVDSLSSVQILPYSGNFVTPFPLTQTPSSPIMAGTLVVKGGKFWSSLEAMLQDVSRTFFWSCEYLHAHDDVDMSKCSVNWTLGMGSTNTKAMPPLVQGSETMYSISYNTDEPQAYDTAGRDDLAGAMKANMNTQGYQHFNLTPGSNIIHVNGFSSYRGTYQQKLAATWWGECWQTSSWTWSYDLTLNTTTDGKLTTTSSNLVVSDQAHDQYIAFGYGGWAGGLLGTIVAVPVVNISVTNMTNLLTRKMQAHAATVLPAAGQYYMVDPKFNNNGDLLVAMTLMAPTNADGPPVISNMTLGG